jgi:predicted N-acetyltransferase YhbS
MNSHAIQFRLACDEDHQQILALHRDAFGVEEGEVIANLVKKMLGDPSAEPVYSFVAELGDQVVGHVLFTAVRVATNKKATSQILAPLGVAEEHQGRGIGTELVSSALDQLQEDGVELVFVLGYPDYYSRFGFAPAGVCCFQAPYPILPKNADAWMVKELTPGAIERYAGTVLCCNSLDHPQLWQE